jgi:MFS family permease
MDPWYVIGMAQHGEDALEKRPDAGSEILGMQDQGEQRYDLGTIVQKGTNEILGRGEAGCFGHDLTRLIHFALVEQRNGEYHSRPQDGQLSSEAGRVRRAGLEFCRSAAYDYHHGPISKGNKMTISASRELKLFAAVSIMMGIAYSIYDSTFNNFINERFSLTGFQRSFLELPRELPGFLVVFVSALLWFLCSRRLGAFALALGAAGVLLIGFIPSTFAVMALCLFIYSIGFHLFIPLASSIGMELAHEGQTGRRLGQLNAIRNFATILGSLLVVLGFRFLGFRFQHTFILTAVGLGVAAVLMLLMKPDAAQKPKTFLKLHKEYRLFYILNILAGSRKQIFITFAPWVIVTIFTQPTQTIATLMTLGGAIGILFQPVLGRAIDHFGERLILQIEAVMLVMVCLGYGFSKFLFPERTAFLFVCGFYLLDQMLLSVNMARSMYMKKIAVDESHVQPALTAGVTIDHLFSIIIALLGGVIWNALGFQYVFLLGILIAALDFLVVSFIRIPPRRLAPEDETPIPLRVEEVM